MDRFKLNELLQNPPVEYRPVVFWSWNEIMEPQQVREQVEMLANAGMGGGFIHSRIGLITDYMKEQWFEAVDAALDQAKKCGLKMYLYDEDKWPSGFAAGAVPLKDESFRMKALVARDASEPMPQDCKPVENSSNNKKICIYTSPLGYDWFNGTCYSDLMNSKAMDFFLEQAYQSYFDRYSQFYGNLIPSEFTDEPCTIFRGRIIAGAVPYSDELPEKFKKMHGYDPEPKYHLLFEDAPGAGPFRIDYFRTVNNLFEMNFSKKLGDWCQSKGIYLTGHYMAEHGLLAQQVWGTKVMPNYRHQGAPGIDHLGRQIDEKISALQCRSVVNQYGKKRMLSELYGCSGQNVSFEDRLWIAAQQICLGVNMLNPHLSLYTMAGCRKRDFPPNIFYQQPWWEVNEQLDIPLSRACAIMSQGKFHPEVLVIHPQESVFALWQTRTDPYTNLGKMNWDWHSAELECIDKINDLDRKFKALLDELLAAKRTFDLGDETIIRDDGKIISEDGKVYFSINQMKYPALVVPEMSTMAESTLELIKEFKTSGGHVLLCGKAPKLLDGRDSKELNDFMSSLKKVSSQQLSEELQSVIEPAVEVESKEDEQILSMLWTHIRELPDGSRLVYLTNLNRNDKINSAVRFNGSYKSIAQLDIWTGQVNPVKFENQDDSITKKMSFAPAEIKILLLAKQQAQSNQVESSELIQVEDIGESLSWTATRLDDNSMTLDNVYYTRDKQWSKEPIFITTLQTVLNEEKYAGPLSLRYTFESLTDEIKKINLVVEHPEYYQIKVNGQPVSYGGLPYWKDPRWLPINISAHVKKGENTIELKCNNFHYGDLTDVHNPAARYGTEIEAVYLVGDFDVNSKIKYVSNQPEDFKQLKLPPVQMLKAKNISFKLDKPTALKYGDLTKQNMPFYAGCASFKLDISKLKKTAQFNKAKVKVDSIDCPCVEVKIDGQSCGFLIGKLSAVDITEKFKTAQKLELVLYGSLRNLLGPHHNTIMEPVWASPQSFLPTFDNADSFSKNVEKWQNGQLGPVDWTDDYYLASFGLIKGLRIEYSYMI